MSGTHSVVLVHPRTVTGWQAQPWCDMPLELLCVGTPLIHAGYRVRVIDQRVMPDWREALLAELSAGPICVGITSTTGPQLKHALDISRLVKKHSDAPVVWGGIHASLLPEQTLQEPDIDIVVDGEGEETFLELVQALEAQRDITGIRSLWHKRRGHATFTGKRDFIDLNKQPSLAYDLVDVGKYTREVFGVKRLSFSTSRGCTHPCAYCYNTVFHRRRWRALRADVAVSQIKEFVRAYGVHGLFPTDANFFLDMDRARGILEGVVRENLNLVFTRLHTRFDTLSKMSDEDLTLIERAGCKCLAVGVESGSERIRHLLRKQIEVDRLLDVNRRLRRFSITPLYFFMIGLPTETEEDLRDTISLFTRLLKENPKAMKSVNIYTPFPGTELFDVAVAHGLKPPERLLGWSSFSYRNLAQRGPWLSKQMRRNIETLDFCSFFVGEKNYLKPIKKTNRLIVFLSNCYAPVARKRIENFFFRFPVEVKLVKSLGLFGKRS